MMSADRLKTASNNPRNPVGPAIAYFGTYSVDEAAKTVTTHIDSCAFPNRNGADRKTSFNISGDELSVQVVSGPLTTVGTGTASLVWKRAK